MKNFVKLIKQVYEERHSVVLKKILDEKIPVAYLTLAPTTQAVDTVKNFRVQGLNITNLVVIDSTPPPTANFDFDIFHVSDAAKIFPKPEYIFTENIVNSRVAIKNFPASKTVFLGNNTDYIYETFMTHLDELQEVYTSLIDEESKKFFAVIGSVTYRVDLVKLFFQTHRITFAQALSPNAARLSLTAGLLMEARQRFSRKWATRFTPLNWTTKILHWLARSVRKKILSSKMSDLALIGTR